MAHRSYKASVPGSLMLMGEHAVLHGSKALVCAINQRLVVELLPHSARTFSITDTRLGTIEQSIDAITIQAPFKFVLSVIQSYKDQLQSGFALNINSEFASVLGLGSSAAVTVATIAVLSQWLHPLSADQILAQAKIIHAGGSAGDLAASVYGGVLCYSMRENNYHKLSSIPYLTAIYCGYKKPTPEVIALVEQQRHLYPDVYTQVFAAINSCVALAEVAIKQGDWQQLGILLDKHHHLQAVMGVSNVLLDNIAATLRTRTEILGAKISGAGLGDCVIGLGKLDEIIFTNQQQQFSLNIAEQGLVYECN